MIRVSSNARKLRDEIRKLLARGGRFDRGVQTFALVMAQDLHAELVSRLRQMPSPASQALADALVVRVVPPDGAGVFANPTPRQMTIIEHETTLIDIKRPGRDPDPLLDYLEAHNPWTFDTVPVEIPTAASVVARQAYVGDVKTIRDARIAADHQRQAVLLGGHPRSSDAEIRVIDDLVALVARGELGILRGISPSWKASVRKVVAHGQDRADEVWWEVFETRRQLQPPATPATAEDMNEAEALARRMGG